MKRSIALRSLAADYASSSDELSSDDDDLLNRAYDRFQQGGGLRTPLLETTLASPWVPADGGEMS